MDFTDLIRRDLIKQGFKDRELDCEVKRIQAKVPEAMKRMFEDYSKDMVQVKGNLDEWLDDIIERDERSNRIRESYNKAVNQNEEALRKFGNNPDEKSR